MLVQKASSWVVRLTTVALCCCSGLRAEPVTFLFESRYDLSYLATYAGCNQCDGLTADVTGSYTFDASQVPSPWPGSPSGLLYLIDSYNVSFFGESYEYPGPSPLNLSAFGIQDSPPGVSPGDIYSLRIPVYDEQGAISRPIAALPGYSVAEFALYFQDTAGNMLDSTAAPTEPGFAAAATTAVLRVAIGKTGDPSGFVSQGSPVSLGATEPSVLVCDIQLSQDTYVDGERITAQNFRLANLGSEAAAVEMKSWLEVPGTAPISLINTGANGFLVLPAGFDRNFGPLPLSTVSPGFPRGDHGWNCRLLDPVTGETKATDMNTFGVQ